MTIYSSIPHATAALYLAHDFIKKSEDKVILFTDDKKIHARLESLCMVILGEPVALLTHASELLSLSTVKEKIILVHSELLRIPGNKESLRRGHTIELRRNETYAQNSLIENLLNIGYNQSDYRGEIGTYKREGSVIRIMTKYSEWMIEYFDDVIENIIEYCEDRHIYHDHLILSRLEETGGKLSEGKDGIELVAIQKELLSLLGKYPLVCIGCEFFHERTFLTGKDGKMLEFSSLEREGSTHLDLRIPEIYTLELLKEYLIKNEGRNISLISRHEKRIREFLDMNGFSHISVTPTKHGIESFIYTRESRNTLFQNAPIPEIVLGDDIWNSIFIENRARKSSIKHLNLLLSIKEGDHVVHREHGIGKYIGLVKKRIGLTEREYMEVAYAAGDRVYIPLTELGRITKYVGDSDVELTRLEGKEWERTLSKTDEEVARIAQEILETDAKRKMTTRIAFGKFENEEAQFKKAFQYTHTVDQSAIIEDIKKDMESPTPMDRLISGDVGFGKTEVAMNAIYKAVLSGMQVAVISPLLILALEHKETFEERLGAFGVRIAALTRMTRPAEEKRILEKMRTGELDVIVGTHRLLSEDIHFRRLGLLIIDEEHRFGVGHKEAIKKMKAHIDIISLSATPIPRSLNLALSGLKTISLLTTPPPDKKPIETIVTRWDEGVLQNAIGHELARSGQVIILHNRIRALPMIEKEIREMMESTHGELKIVTTHGQMPADEIEDRIYDFKHGKYQILLSTTVIENGVNFLSANTIIVSDAEEFGLAQLHQIRGRVGRKDVHGKCYLMYRKYELSHAERERLLVLSENSALGSGYEIAMRDMQIRGTGDILGFRQSGKSKEVGISLYFQLLEEKVESLKTGKKQNEQTKIELDLSYLLPDDYFDSDIDKLSFFREVESIETLEDLDRAEKTFVTGEEITTIGNLFLMLRTSLILKQYNVMKLSKIGVNYHFDFREGTTPAILRAFLDRFDSGHEMIIVSVTKIKVDTKNWEDTQSFLSWITKGG